MILIRNRNLQNTHFFIFEYKSQLFGSGISNRQNRENFIFFSIQFNRFFL